MHEAESLEKMLKKHIVMNAARIKFVAGFIIAVLKVETVNLKKIAIAFPGNADKDSKYKRIQRFFGKFPLDLNMIAKWIAAIIPNKDKPWVLSMDRTNWKFGKININILVLGIVYKGIAFPLIWFSLSKRGNSNTQERIDIIKRFMDLFGVEKILCLTGDREFIGTDWFGFLIEAGIPFTIRIKKNTLVPNARGVLTPVKYLFRGLSCGSYMILRQKREVLGHKLHIIASRLPTGEYLIITTNKDPENALKYYKMRWGIETLFGCLKKRGFQFESTHMTHLERIEKLVAFLTITFVWCHIIGEWKHDQKKIKIKKHGRKSTSIFRYGCNEIREILLNISSKKFDFQRALCLLFGNVDPEFSLINDKTYKRSNFLSCT